MAVIEFFQSSIDDFSHMELMMAGLNLRNIQLQKYLAILIEATIMALFLAACETPTSLSIEGGDTPVFKMSGSARFNGLRISGPKMREAVGETQYIVWEFRSPIDKAEFVSTIGPIVYGETPSSYRQVYPERGKAPPIVEGERYYVIVLTTGAPGIEKYFTIKNGKVIVEDTR